MDNLILVGFSCSGKTTLGRNVARRLRLNFVDSDRCIEEMTGRTIPEIFREDGEDGFRRVEREAISRIMAGQNQVVSTGGGAFVDPENREMLRNGNLVIHLQVRPETVVDRLRNSKSGRPRPLLESPDPLERVIRLMAERKEAYSAAHVTIGVDDRSRYELVGELRRRWLAWQRAHRAPGAVGDADALTGFPRASMSGDNVVTTQTLRAGGRAVPLLAGPGALDRMPKAMADAGFTGRLFVVADEYASSLHGERLRAVLPQAPVLHISGQEADKTLENVAHVWDWLLDQGAQRRDALVAFGGGVVCDLAGFAAACYLRGIGLVNAPTTLLAQVDAAVGGKTGVNHPRGKNLIGAFFQPMCVVADTGLLATLGPRAFAAGMAEVAKMAMILDADLFSRLEGLAAQLGPRDGNTLAPLIARSIELKAHIVERDEREAGDRMLLNYGHTVGHALEAGVGYGALLHGEAVAVGMQAAAHIALRLGMLGGEDARRQTELLRALRLPLCWPAPVEDVIGRLALDKKRAGDRQRWVLAERVGAGRVRDDVPAAVAREAIERITNLTADR